ncbi:hypothetical protein ACFLXY_11035 [Chloroflexota bacterium]
MSDYCTKPHRYWSVLDNLPDSQADTGRHRCAGCAYEQGYDDYVARRRNHLNTNKLKYSQAGSARHKDIQAAYELGYNRAKLGLPKERLNTK